MKCCMVACINILYWITEVPEVKIFSEKKMLLIDSKWSETRKKLETANPFTADAAADRFPQ